MGRWVNIWGKKSGIKYDEFPVGNQIAIAHGGRGGVEEHTRGNLLESTF